MIKKKIRKRENINIINNKLVKLKLVILTRIVKYRKQK